MGITILTDKFIEFLDRAKEVTWNYRRSGVKPSINDWFKKINKEVKELETAKDSVEELEEGWDVIFTILTLFHIRGYTTDSINESAQNTLKKIEERSEKFYNEHIKL